MKKTIVWSLVGLVMLCSIGCGQKAAKENDGEKDVDVIASAEDSTRRTEEDKM